MSWLPFALAAPLLFGSTNFIDKFLIQKRVKDPIALTMIGGITGLVAGLIFFAINGRGGVDGRSIFILLISGALFQFALIPYYWSLEQEDTSRIVPLFQVIPILTLVLSAIFLGEHLLPRQFIGFCIILVGGIAVSLERGARGMLRVRKAFWWMMLSSLLYTLPIIMFKSVSTTDDFWHSLAFESLGSACGAIVLACVPRYRKRFFAAIRNTHVGTWAPIGLNELMDLGGRMALFFASTLAPLALVTVVGAIQPLFVLLIGLGLTVFFPRILKEDIRNKVIALKVAAALIVLVGIIVMSTV
ncbi:MAG: EamA family transporter [bacterium]|nr:EamA family transporter [bacterium]